MLSISIDSQQVQTACCLRFVSHFLFIQRTERKRKETGCPKDESFDFIEVGSITFSTKTLENAQVCQSISFKINHKQRP